MPVRRLSATLLLLAATSLPAEDAPLPFPDMCPTVGAFVQKHYYDHARFRPRLMVMRGLRALQNAEIGIQAVWNGATVVVTAPGLAEPQQVAATEPTDVAQAMTILENVRLAVDGSELPAERKRELAYHMLNGALLSLDPHTNIEPPEPAKEMVEGLAGEFYGIGAYLTQDEGVIAIERVMPGMPAERAGVEDGDIVLAVDGEKTAGLSLDQAVRRIKGPKGTTVQLTLERKGQGAPLGIPVVRDLVQIVRTRHWRRGDIGYLRMDEFNAKLASDVQAALGELQRQGPLKALVLDLRFNPGGILDQAQEVSDLFLPGGLEIVRTVSAEGRPTVLKSSSRQAIDVPIMVLVSGGSASASEILSGCLQRNERALVVGVPTFGKGSVQTLRPLRDRSRLRLTIQEYRLPGDVSIQGTGVTPDLRLVRRSTGRNGRIDLVPFTLMKEKDDEFAIPNTHAWLHDPAYVMGWLAPRLGKEEGKRSSIASPDFRPDPEAMLVVDLLAEAVAAAGWDEGARAAAAANRQRPFLVERLKEPVARRAERESQALGEALAHRGEAAGGPVAWGPAAPPAPGAIAIAYQGPARLAAGAAADLPFQVSNRGATPVARLYGVVKTDVRSPLWEDEVVIGEVPAGGAVVRPLRFRVPPRLFPGQERFTVEVFADGIREPLASVPVALQIDAKERPRFGFSWKIEDNAVLRPGDAAVVAIEVFNEGAGASGPVVARVFKANDPFLQLGDSRFKFKEGIPAGGRVQLRVPVTIREKTPGGRAFTAKSVKLQFNVQEDFSAASEPGDGDDAAEEVDHRYRAALFSTLTIPVGEPAQGRTVHQPLIRLIKAETLPGNQAHLTVELEDDNPRWLTLFVGEDKLDLRPVLAEDMKAGRLTYDKRFALKPGVNQVRVEVADHDQVASALPLRLWGEGEPAAAATAAATGTAGVP
jgi:carboxyl-terminal processing protease